MDAEDGDLLHAVMAFLEENDAMEILDETSDSNSSQSDSDPKNSTHPPPPPTSTETKKPVLQQTVLPLLKFRQPTVNRSRERMRKELVVLREQVLELQDRLEGMQGGVAAQFGIHGPPPRTAGEEHEARKLRALAWQALAEHEDLKRISAEQERDKLRALLKQQKLAFRRLRRYLTKYAAKPNWAALRSELVLDGEPDQEEQEEEQGEVGAPPATPGHPEPPSVGDFEEISKVIPTMYLQTSAVFTDKRLETLTSSLRDLKVQNEQTTKMSIESLDSRLVPFDVAQTARAVWEFHLTKVKKLSHHVDQKIEESENTIKRIFSAGIKFASANTGTARVRMETRRFVENADRVVILQSTIYDHLQVNNGSQMDRFSLRQFQWTVISPPRHFLLRHGGKPMSQVEIFEVTVPVFDHISGMERPKVLSQIKSLCEESSQVHMELERESVENILMDSLLQRAHLDQEMLQPPA